VSGAWLNFPTDPSSTGSYANTRDSASNATYKAIPWRALAADMLWNCTVPSWSFTDTSRAITSASVSLTFKTRFWKMNLLHTGSFFYEAYGITSFSNRGTSQYQITSSWHIIDPKFIGRFTYPNGPTMSYVHSASRYESYPTYIGSHPLSASLKLAGDSSSFYAYDISYPDITNTKATSSADGGYFDRGGGAGITKTYVSLSYATESLYDKDNSVEGLALMTTALKQRRLYFPTQLSSGPLSYPNRRPSYWFEQITKTSYSNTQGLNIFTENGGIYNIILTLKKYPGSGYEPDTGTHMKVFISDVLTTVTGSQARVAGTKGWYPPDNNIVIIGNGYGTAPEMTFYDIQTGYKIERYNFNVIQYGFPAQLCLEACGDIDADTYFGIIVDDIDICKIGVIADPRYIENRPITDYVDQALGIKSNNLGGITEV
jgi:hypothetical protein